ncbi:hypothetical protein SLAV_37150 [Streptomyces lavendulae subsp. lavendulae]|uniref:Uncharacterized protein n=1 Tax=Streptomyces lavendulae subsp. lavendulae TaxID=58340 RepID=A0A2K8PU62_STRLA|nr:hypothetical protein SLAV_37150 [Streptomyces lavendulae subsp. lavendulae]QUQ59011.1 hypothetical protein SLLC_35310 [Streptomyces lavendulae subsp. lavendulae]
MVGVPLPHVDAGPVGPRRTSSARKASTKAGGATLIGADAVPGFPLYPVPLGRTAPASGPVIVWLNGAHGGGQDDDGCTRAATDPGFTGARRRKDRALPEWPACSVHDQALPVLLFHFVPAEVETRPLGEPGSPAYVWASSRPNAGRWAQRARISWFTRRLSTEYRAQDRRYRFGTADSGGHASRCIRPPYLASATSRRSRNFVMTVNAAPAVRGYRCWVPYHGNPCPPRVCTTPARWCSFLPHGPGFRSGEHHRDRSMWCGSFRGWPDGGATRFVHPRRGTPAERRSRGRRPCAQVSGRRSQTSEKASPCSRVTTPHGQPSVIRRQSHVTTHGPAVRPHPGQRMVSAVHTPGAGRPWRRKRPVYRTCQGSTGGVTGTAPGGLAAARVVNSAIRSGSRDSPASVGGTDTPSAVLGATPYRGAAAAVGGLRAAYQGRRARPTAARRAAAGGLTLPASRWWTVVRRMRWSRRSRSLADNRAVPPRRAGSRAVRRPRTAVAASASAGEGRHSPTARSCRARPVSRDRARVNSRPGPPGPEASTDRW